MPFINVKVIEGVFTDGQKSQIVESLTERCDSCSAAAKLEVHLTTGGGLAFCGHHANKHGTELFRLIRQVLELLSNGISCKKP